MSEYEKQEKNLLCGVFVFDMGIVVMVYVDSSEKYQIPLVTFIIKHLMRKVTFYYKSVTDPSHLQ